MNVTPEQVIAFWREAGPKKWFKKDDTFDEEIRTRFGETLEKAGNGELDHWTHDPNSSLALILVLDQFSRNLHRDSAKAFENDDKCVAIVQDMMKSGDDRKVPDDLAPFIYMPLMHSENLADQEECITQMQRLGKQDNVKFAIIHRDIIEKFGRFPHRNKVLGRETTPEEQAFLDEGGFAG